MQACLDDWDVNSMNGGVEPCLICGCPATQYFGSNTNYPVCGSLSCDAALVAEINAELNEAAAEAAQLKGD